jgi:hypothetical protein
MLAYVPKFIQQVQAYKAVIDAQGAEFDTLRTNIEDILKQFYVETATEWGLDLWEQMLDLKSYAGKPLDQRRSRIISKLRGMGTVTISLIKNVAESYVNGTVEVAENTSEYGFTIKFIDTRGVPPNLDDLKNAIEEIKPAHLAVEYKFRYLIWDELDNINTTWDSLDAHLYSWDQLEVLDPATY